MIKNIFVMLEIIEDKVKEKKKGQVACVLYIRSFSVGPNLKVDEALILILIASVDIIKHST